MLGLDEYIIYIISNYNYDFEVICTKNDEEIFHKIITDVTIGSYLFSGGW